MRNLHSFCAVLCGITVALVTTLAFAVTLPWVEEVRPASTQDVEWVQQLLQTKSEGDLDPAAWFHEFREASQLRNDRPAEAAARLQRLAEQYPESPRVWTALAWAYYGAEQWPEGAQAFARVVEIGSDRIYASYYNQACCFALGGEPERAIEALEMAIATGWEQRSALLEDADLNSLHDNTRFQKLAGFHDIEGLDRVTGWRVDIDFLLVEIERMHWRMSHGGDMSPVRQRLESLSDRVEELEDGQIAAEFVQVLASMGDGHTSFYPVPGRINPFQTVPLSTYWFADGLFVVETTDPTLEHYVGSRVLSMGGVPAEEIALRLAPFIPRDNPMGILWMGPTFLRFSPVLEAAGMLDTNGGVSFELVSSAGQRETITLEPSGDPTDAHVGGLPSLHASIEPLWLHKRERNYWAQWLEAESVLYINYSSVRNESDEGIADFAVRVRGMIDANSPRALVIDVRRNGGGNSFLNRPMLATLIHFENTQPEGQLFALAGRNTFSAAQNFLAEVDYYTGAVIAGEPSGSRPNFIGESSEFVLPWSGLRGSISTRYHQSSYPTDHRLWIGPDLPARLTSGDFFSGVDPVMDAVLATVSETQSASEGGSEGE